MESQTQCLSPRKCRQELLVTLFAEKQEHSPSVLKELIAHLSFDLELHDLVDLFKTHVKLTPANLETLCYYAGEGKRELLTYEMANFIAEKGEGCE